MSSRPLVFGKNFTTTGADSALDLRGLPVARFGIQVKGIGAAATTWSVNVEGSLDGVNFTSILTHANADVDGTVKWATTQNPSAWVRINVTSLTLGPASAINVNIVGSE